MKKRLLWAGMFPVCVMLSCSGYNESQFEEKDLGIAIDVAISSVEGGSRTGLKGGHTVFVEADRIGFFMPGENVPVAWTCNQGGSWTPEHALYWPDKETSFEFDAFYPYVEGAVRGNVPMPDLTTQHGRPDRVGEYDFLAAKTTASYPQAEGKVSFTGTSSFRHLYSLVWITLCDGDRNGKRMLIEKLAFHGEGMVRSHYWNCESGEMKPQGDDLRGDDLEWKVPASEGEVMPEGYQVALLINPSVARRKIVFQLAYEKGGVRYRAETPVINAVFESGKVYRYTMRTQKNALTLIGCDITDWKNGVELDDIVIDGELAGLEKV